MASDRFLLGLCSLFLRPSRIEKVAATHLLTELGEGGLTVPSPEGQLDDALDEVERAAPEDLAPIEWNAPEETAPERDSAPERQRYDHIPLEPEDPEGRR